MTDIELLLNVINTLDRINIPIVLVEQIGIPIANASNQLKALYTSVTKKAEKDAVDNSENAEEIKMEVVEETSKEE